MPLDKTGGEVKYIQNKDAICLTKDQTKYVYKKVEQGNPINTEKMRQEIEHERLAETKIDSEDDNPYKRVILKQGL